jgi:glucose-6-phosphate 1-dehydrogenase
MNPQESFSLIIFGATGNLAQLKLIPALYDLVEANLLPEKMTIIGIGRKELSH